MKDKVINPKHYFGIDGLEVEQILREFLPRIKDPYVAHRIASAIEYQLRAPLKNGLEDYKKARKNLDQVIEYLENQESEQVKIDLTPNGILIDWMKLINEK